MNPTKALIAEAVTRFPLHTTAAWASLKAADAAAEIERIEADPTSITTVDCLFDGQASIVLKGDRVVPAMIFGRFDGRRAEIERIVLSA